MPSSCFFGCVTKAGTTLHTFPNPKRFPERFKTWVELGGEELKELSVNEIFPRVKVCDKHFLDSHRNRYRRLNALATPTLHLPRLPQIAEASKENADELDNAVENEKALLQQPPVLSNCEAPMKEILSNKEAETEANLKTRSTEQNTLSHCEKYEKYQNLEHLKKWQLKLTHILHKTEFCGICLNADGGMNAVSDDLEINDDERTYRKTLRHIVDKVFKETDYPLANSKICNSCTKTLIHSYIFIRNAEETSKLLDYHLNELYNKVCYINNNLKQKQASSKIFNVIITLDKDIFENFDCNKMETAKSKTKSKLDHPRVRRKLPYMSRNVILPSKKAWMIYKTTTHNNNYRCRICLQSFKTPQDFTAHYKTHLKSRCTICHRTVQDGRLVQHLKSRHKHSIHSCPICDDAFYSAKALETHYNKCHYRDDSKCMTCLKSLSQDELVLHQCRFKCPECSEAPCVHHKYLMSYKEQMMNFADTVSCVDCTYLCTSKGALIAHVNAQHLNAHSCGTCSQKFHHRSDLRSHVCKSKQISKYVYDCGYCDKRFSNQYICQ